MANSSEKTLNALLSTANRIEKLLESEINKKDKSLNVNKVIGGIDRNFAKMSKNLEKIVSQTKTTNQLLEKLIDINTYKAESITKETKETVKQLNALGKNTEKLFKAIQLIGKIPDKAINKFGDLLMLLAFINPKTQKPIADKEQLEQAKQTSKILTDIVKGIALFGLVLVGFSFVVPQILKGVLGFVTIVATLTFTLLGISKIIKGKKKMFDTGPLASLLSLGKGIALFGLMFVGFSLVLPLIAKGALGFLTIMSALTLGLIITHLALKITGKNFNPFKDNGPLGTVLKLGKSIALFGIMFIGFSLTLPLIAVGAIGFLTLISGLTLGILLMHKVLGKSSLGSFSKKGKIEKEGKGALGTLSKLLFSITLFSITMVLIGLTSKQFALGSLTVILSLTALSGVLQLIGTKRTEKGAKSLQTLGISLGIFTGSMLVWTLLVQPKLTWEGIAMLAAVVGVMGLIGTVLGIPPMDKYVRKGSNILQELGLSLIIFSTGLTIYAQMAAPKLNWKKIGMLATVIGVMGLIGTVLGIPPISVWIKSGAIGLIILGGALIVFSGGLAVYAQMAAPKLTWENIAMLGSVIAGMAIVGTILGVPPVFPFVLLGAGALIALGGALISFSFGLSIFAKSGFKKEDSENLNDALRSTIAGFLGYKSLEEVGLSSLVKIPMLMGLLTTAGIAMNLISLALLPLSRSLLVFKKTNWNEENTKNLNSTILAIVKGFTENLENVNWKKVKWGVGSLENLGKTLIGLAEGIRSFANLTFTEYEYDEKTGKLKPIKKVPITSDMIIRTGESIALVISALTKPLADFGEQISGGSGSGFLGINWGKMISIKFGIESLQQIGSGLVNLAKGVQDWANMTITEYEVKTNPKTGMPEIVPKNRRPIGTEEVNTAMENIAIVLSGLTKPLSDFGSIFSQEQQGFFGPYKVENKGLKLGIELMSQIGKGLIDIANSVSLWADFKYVKYGIQKNKKTGMNELVPIGFGEITQGKIDLAMEKIGIVLSALIYPISKFGEMFVKTEKGWFGTKYDVDNKAVIKGIEMMTSVGNGLSTIADMIAKWANLEYTEMEVKKDPKTGLSKLQPKAIKPLGSEKIELAKTNIKSVLMVMVNALNEHSIRIKNLGLEEKIPSVTENISKIQNIFGNLLKWINEKWNDENSLTTSERFRIWIENLSSPLLSRMLALIRNFGKISNEFSKNFKDFVNVPQKLALTEFTNNIIKLANTATKFEKFVSAFERMSIAMGDFSKNFNLMNVDGIKAFTTWSNALLQVVEVGKNKDSVSGFFDVAASQINAGFEYAKNTLFGGDENEIDESQKKSLIEKTNEMTKNVELEKLIQAVNSLKIEIVGLKSAMSGVMDVNITNAWVNVRTDEE